jgi:Ca-activated chloride channel family protein
MDSARAERPQFRSFRHDSAAIRSNVPRSLPRRVAIADVSLVGGSTHMRSAQAGWLLCFMQLLAAPSLGAELPDDVRGSVLLVRDARSARWTPVPALATDVELRIAGIVARARVSQTFRNPTDRWLEAVYVFPLPETAAVDHMTLEVGGRVLEGQVREKEAAKREYRAARDDGKAATLLEQARPNVFTISVANLGPGEEARVRIELQDTVQVDASGFRIRFPMVVAPRYEAGPPAPGERRVVPVVLHPDDGPVNPFRLTVELDAGFPVAEVGSASHAVLVTDLAASRRRIVTGDYADRDFVLAWKPEPGTEPRAVLLAEADGDEGFALVLVTPPAGPATPETLRREVVFVIDTSGSMAGESIAQARRALQLAIAALGPDDRFDVIRFDDDFAALFGAPAPADAAHREEAQRYVAGLEAEGGTNMEPALRAALASDTGAGDLRQVVFATDGCVGGEEALFAAIRTGLGRSRLFTVGIGSAPNGHFLTRAAALGRGTHTFVASPGEVDARMGELLAKLAQPVLSDLELRLDGALETWPDRIPDLYAGEPVVVAARVRRLAGEAVLRGRRGDRPFEVRMPLEPGPPQRGIGVLFARRKIAALLAEPAADPAAVRAAVVELALRHHLVSPFTSLVAVDVTPVRPLREALARGDVPVNLPAGWEAVKVGGVLPRAGTEAPLLRLLGALCLAAAPCLALLRRVQRA